MIEELKKVQKDLAIMKKAYLNFRKQGLGREAWEGQKEIEETLFFDEILEKAMKAYVIKVLDETLGLTPETKAPTWTEDDDDD